MFLTLKSEYFKMWLLYNCYLRISRAGKHFWTQKNDNIFNINAKTFKGTAKESGITLSSMKGHLILRLQTL